MASGEWKNDILTWNVNGNEYDFDFTKTYYQKLSESLAIPKTVWDKDRFEGYNIASSGGYYTTTILAHDWTKPQIVYDTTPPEPKIYYTIGKYYAKRKTINYKSSMHLFNTLDECVKFLYDEIGDTLEYCVYQVEIALSGNICTRVEF